MQIEEIEKIIATQRETGNKELECQLRYWEGYLSGIADIEAKIQTILHIPPDSPAQSATIIEEAERINLDEYEWLGSSTDNFTKYVCRCGVELRLNVDGTKYKCVSCGKEYHLRVIFKAGNYYFYIKKI